MQQLAALRIVEQAARRPVAKAHHPPCDAACRHRSAKALAALDPRLCAAAVLQQQPVQHRSRAVSELSPDRGRVRSAGLTRAACPLLCGPGLRKVNQDPQAVQAQCRRSAGAVQAQCRRSAPGSGRCGDTLLRSRRVHGG